MNNKLLKKSLSSSALCCLNHLNSQPTLRIKHFSNSTRSTTLRNFSSSKTLPFPSISTTATTTSHRQYIQQQQQPTEEDLLELNEDDTPAFNDHYELKRFKKGVTEDIKIRESLPPISKMKVELFIHEVSKLSKPVEGLYYDYTSMSDDEKRAVPDATLTRLFWTLRSNTSTHYMLKILHATPVFKLRLNLIYLGALLEKLVSVSTIKQVPENNKVKDGINGVDPPLPKVSYMFGKESAGAMVHVRRKLIEDVEMVIKKLTQWNNMNLFSVVATLTPYYILMGQEDMLMQYFEQEVVPYLTTDSFSTKLFMPTAFPDVAKARKKDVEGFFFGKFVEQLAKFGKIEHCFAVYKVFKRLKEDGYEFQNQKLQLMIMQKFIKISLERELFDNATSLVMLLFEQDKRFKDLASNPNTETDPDLLHELKDYVYLVNLVLRSFMERDMFQDAVLFLDNAFAMGFKPDNFTHNIFLRHYIFKRQNLVDAFQYLQENEALVIEESKRQFNSLLEKLKIPEWEVVNTPQFYFESNRFHDISSLYTPFLLYFKEQNLNLDLYDFFKTVILPNFHNILYPVNKNKIFSMVLNGLLRPNIWYLQQKLKHDDVYGSYVEPPVPSAKFYFEEFDKVLEMTKQYNLKQDSAIMHSLMRRMCLNREALPALQQSLSSCLGQYQKLYESFYADNELNGRLNIERPVRAVQCGHVVAGAVQGLLLQIQIAHQEEDKSFKKQAIDKLVNFFHHYQFVLLSHKRVYEEVIPVLLEIEEDIVAIQLYSQYSTIAVPSTGLQRAMAVVLRRPQSKAFKPRNTKI